MMDSNFDFVNDTPIEHLPQVMATLGESDRARARARLRGHKALAQEGEATLWRQKQMPENMEQPMAVRIKMWQGSAVVGSWFITDRSVPGAREVRPSEVVVVDMKDDVFRRSFAKGFLEVVESAPTRPIVYDSKQHARLLDPIVRPGRRTPKAHVDAARDEAGVTLAKIREQYAASQLPSNSDLPKAAQAQLRAIQLEKQVQAELGDVAPSTAEVVTHENGAPKVTEDGVVARKRAKAK